MTGGLQLIYKTSSDMVNQSSHSILPFSKELVARGRLPVQISSDRAEELPINQAQLGRFAEVQPQPRSVSELLDEYLSMYTHNCK